MVVRDRLFFAFSMIFPELFQLASSKTGAWGSGGPPQGKIFNLTAETPIFLKIGIKIVHEKKNVQSVQLASKSSNLRPWTQKPLVGKTLLLHRLYFTFLAVTGSVRITSWYPHYAKWAAKPIHFDLTGTRPANRSSSGFGHLHRNLSHTKSMAFSK